MVGDASHGGGRGRRRQAGRAQPGCLAAAAMRDERVLRVLDDTPGTR